MKNVRIIGLGLMGTNLGLNLISKGIKVYGEDVNDYPNNRANKLGIDINKTMVEQYYAVAYYGQNKEEVEETHLLNRAKLIELGVFTPVEV